MTLRALGTWVPALELSRHMGKDGVLTPFIKTLSKQIQMYGDAHQEVANDGSGHQGTTQNFQPNGAYFGFNEGYPLESSESGEFREPLTMLGSRFAAHVEVLLKKARGDKGRAREIRARMMGEHAVGMLKNHMTNLLYGTRATGKSPLGIFARADYNNLTSPYVHDNAAGAASATANKMSVLIVGWGPEKYTFIHPMSQAPEGGVIDQPGSPIEGIGVKIVTLHDDWVTGPEGDADKQFLAVRNDIQLQTSHAIMDARYVQRIVNISASNIDGVDDFAFDPTVLINALHALPNQDNAVIYVNKLLAAQIDNAAVLKGNVFHMATDPFGVDVPHVRGVPIHLNEMLTSTEATVT